MKLSITIDDDVVRRARNRAHEQGTSVDAIVCSFLERYAGADEAWQARAHVVELARTLSAAARVADGGRSWKRDDIYADRVARLDSIP